MQLESFNICQQASEKTGLDYELLKSVNDVFFSSLASIVRNPPSLIVKIPVFGHFYYRERKSIQRLEGGNYEEEFGQHLERVVEWYKEFHENKIGHKYEKFGKESHDAYRLAKAQERISLGKKG